MAGGLTAGLVGARLTDRDRALLRQLGEHEPLTTSELRLLFFSGTSRCRRRLRHLESHDLLQRVYPARTTRGGGSEALWFLTAEGRRLLELPTRRDPGLSIPDLEHRRAVAQYMTGLVQHSLERDGEGLYSWLGEQAAARALAGACRPDGYGRYLHPEGEISFYLELDRGTEPAHRLRDKLAAYGRALARAPNAEYGNVILLLRGARRLRSVDDPALAGPPWLWASTDAQHYRLLGTEGDTRPLNRLPARPRNPARRLGDCLGRRWQTGP